MKRRLLAPIVMAAVLMLCGAPAAFAAGGEGGSVSLPNLITVLLDIGGPEFRESKLGHFLHHYEYEIFMLIVVAFMILIVYTTAKLRSLMPTRMQAVLEMTYEGFQNLVCGILGPEGKKHVPFFGSLFLFIWFNNMFGLVPLMTGGTSKMTTTFALAGMVFFYIHFHGLKESGIRGYLYHMAGEPTNAVTWMASPLIFVLELLSKFIQPLSLALRLFGNVSGEHILSGVFLVLGLMMASAIVEHPPIGVPLHLPIMFLGLLVGTIQALVFTLLSIIYLYLVLPHHDHAHDEEHEGGHAAAHH